MGVDRLGPAERDDAAGVLARAFADDPLLTFLLGPGRDRELRLIFGALCRDALAAGTVEGVRAGGRLAGVAVWLPPGAHPPGARRDARLLPDWLRLLGRHPRAVPRLLRAGRVLDGLHPPEPHWFLSLLGVEPGLQDGGLGGQLVAAGLGRAGEQPVHLDTARPENVAWYRGFGFEIEQEVHAVRGAPPSWAMRKGGQPHLTPL